MSLTSDIQSKLAHYASADVLLAVGAIADVASGSIDTEGANAISLGLLHSRPLVDGADVLTYKFQDSDNGSTGWADIAPNGYAELPYSQDGKVIQTVVGENQNVGCFSSKRYVRIVFNGIVATADVTVSLPYVLELNLRENDRYIPGGLPGDGLP